jgi:hypothetical protein
MIANESPRKSQYERHFKQWGFQKNTNKAIWVAAASRTAKRKTDEKETEVWIGSERVPEKRLKKEVARYGYDAEISYGSRGKYLLESLLVVDM